MTAVCDANSDLVGTSLFGVPVYHVDDLAVHLAGNPVDIGELTVSEGAAHELKNSLGEGGVKGR